MAVPVGLLAAAFLNRTGCDWKLKIALGTRWLSRVEGKTHPHYHSILAFPFHSLSLLKLELNKLFSLPLEQFVPASVNENRQNLRNLETYLSRVIGPR